MTLLTRLMSGGKPFWNALPEAPKRPLEEAYKVNLAAFSKSEIGRKDCIENCSEAIEETFPLAEGDLSERSLQAIVEQLTKFNRAVDEARLPIDQADKLKKAFQIAFSKVVIRRWTLVMAMNFYPISEISNPLEQIIALEKWTHGFFFGVGYFSGMQDIRISTAYVDWFQRKTLLSLNEYSQDVQRQKIEAMVRQANKGPIKGAVKSEIAGLPQMNQMRPLLMKGVAVGLHLRKNNIVDPSIIRQHFLGIFNKSNL